MRQAIKELAEKRQKWVEANRENGFENGLKRLLTELYPDNAHFIYELLQNAEDALANEVRFILYEDRIEFEHDGERLFTAQDVDAITSIGFSTKRDDATKIGKFGVGFKAVFAYTQTPQIKSGDVHFRIYDMVVPELSELSSKSPTGLKQTRFSLPFDNSKKTPEQARREIERLLKELNATTLLFLTRIRKIEYLLPDSSLGYIERIGLGENRFEILVQHPHQNTPSSTCYMKFDKDVLVEDEEAENESPIKKACRISVAFGLLPIEVKASAKEKKMKKGGDADSASEWELAPMEPGRVCIYFPADKETSNLRFHLHAPFASTVARDSVRDCSGNNLLRDHLADLLAESMSAIRDQGLLTVRSLAVLPNEKDNLPKFYQPFMERLIEEFHVKNLVPMKCGGHAAADGIFRGTKALSDLIDDDDMVKLLGDNYSTPMWVSNPPQRNQREDSFLSLLNIEQWDVTEFLKALKRLNKDALERWMGDKDNKWHQALYEMLIDYMNSTPKYPHTLAAERIAAITCIGLIRCIDGIYRKGSDCFFPTDGIKHDDKFPRVSKGVYFSDKEENKKALEFLVTIGVREVDEKAEIEYILKERYSQEAEDKEQFTPEFNDISRFIVFSEKYPDDIELFLDHYIFQLKDGLWGKPDQVYLDVPFMDTDLDIYYQVLGSQAEQWELSEEYKTCRISPKKIGEFAKKLGAITVLSIDSYNGHYSKDYNIKHIEYILDSVSIKSSKLIWRTCVLHENSGTYFYKKQSRPDGRYSFRDDGDSSIISTLKEYNWVPQETENTIKFVQPRDATAERLPEGFVYQTGWQWLEAIEFGLRVKKQLEVQRREKELQSQEYKRKKEAAKELGFDSPEEAEEVAKLKKEDPDGYMKFKESASRKGRPMFPTKPVANPERRQERLGKQLTDAPDKEYEKRERSVRTTNGAIDPTTWLRNQYTNEAGQMVCQICKEEMPFRKRDGAHYFEKKEVLSRKYLLKEHEAQYLALCPVCAAKFNEFVKTDDEIMSELRKEIVSAKDCDIPISLGDEKTSIRFVETHYHDLKTIIEGGERGRRAPEP